MLYSKLIPRALESMSEELWTIPGQYLMLAYRPRYSIAFISSPDSTHPRPSTCKAFTPGLSSHCNIQQRTTTGKHNLRQRQSRVLVDGIGET